MKYKTLINSVLVVLFLSFSLSSFSQDISLKEIMKGNEFIGSQPQNISWSHDSRTIFFDWKQKQDFDYRTYQYDKGKVSQMPYEEYSLNRMEAYERYDDHILFSS